MSGPEAGVTEAGVSRALIALDLDGTLEDSRADMVAAIQRQRQRLGLEVRPDSDFMAHVHRGMDHLYRHCFADYLAAGGTGADPTEDPVDDTLDEDLPDDEADDAAEDTGEDTGEDTLVGTDEDTGEDTLVGTDEATGEDTLVGTDEDTGEDTLDDTLDEALDEALDEPGVDPRLDDLRRAYEDDYLAHIADTTRLYPGMAEALAELATLGSLAIVTNKPERLSRALLDALGVGHHFSAVIGGDTCAEAKPSPVPLAEARRRAGCAEPHPTVMIGDSAGDIRCARAFGAPVIWCAWGYADEPGPIAPDATAQTAGDLPGLVRQILALDQA